VAANKLVKHMAIARSGVYLYRREELPSLGISAIPAEYQDQITFGVYRPATVLARKANLFSRLPVTLEHPDQMLNPVNVDLYMNGYTGDQVDAVHDPNTNEVFLISSMTLVTASSIDAYDSGIREISPGYNPTVIWSKGVHNDEDYQLMVTDITDANHVALVRKARGGSATCIFDSEGGRSMKDKRFFSGLWRFLKKKANGAEDTDLGAARRILMEIAEKKDAMSDEEIAAKVAEVEKLAVTLPESEGKGKLARFLEDFKQSKMMDPAAVSEAAEMIASLFEELDTAAMAEMTGVGVAPASEEPVATKEPVATVTEEPTQEPAVVAEPTSEDTAPGGTSLTKPAQYVPGQKAVGEDGCSDEDISSFLGSLKGKKISPKQAIYILQELLSEEQAEVTPEVKPVAEEAAPEVKPEATSEETPKVEETEPATKDSLGFTASLSDDGKHNKTSLAAFFSENFGVKERI